jgi:hypothetical protein
MKRIGRSLIWWPVYIARRLADMDLFEDDGPATDSKGREVGA